MVWSGIPITKEQLLWMLCNRPSRIMWRAWYRTLPDEQQEWVRVQAIAVHRMLHEELWNLRVQEMNDAITRVGQQMVTAIAPTLERAMKAIAALNEGLRGLLGTAAVRAFIPQYVSAFGAARTRPKARVEVA